MKKNETDRDVLERRAQALARTRTEQRARGQDVALFERQNVRYAIDASYVTEVARVIAPTPLPLTASYWLGLSSLHGELLGVVDLPRLLVDAPASASDGEHDENDQRLVLVIGRERSEFALLIDRVLEGRSLGDDLVPLGSHESGSARGLLGGATADGVRLVVAEALIADSRLFLSREDSDHPQPL
jgi:chemotaxis signal transduction protein